MQSELFPLADRAVVGSHTAVVLFEIHQIVYISSDQGNIFGIFAGARNPLLQKLAVLGDESCVIMTFYKIRPIFDIHLKSVPSPEIADKYLYIQYLNN